MRALVAAAAAAGRRSRRSAPGGAPAPPRSARSSGRPATWPPRARAPTAWPRSCAAVNRTAFSISATCTRPARCKDFRRWYHPRFGRLAPITDPTIGNHEWDNRFQGYYRYWYRRKGWPLPPWFKTQIAGWEILSLNSQAPHRSDSAQLSWLRSALAGPGDCRIAFWHRPRYSEGAYGGAPDLNPLWNALSGHARSCSAGTTTTSSGTPPSAGSSSTSSAPAGGPATSCTGPLDDGLGHRQGRRRPAHRARRRAARCSSSALRTAGCWTAASSAATRPHLRCLSSVRADGRDRRDPLWRPGHAPARADADDPEAAR